MAAPDSAKAEQILQSNDNFETKTCNVWRTEDISIFPGTKEELDLYRGFDERLSDVDRMTKSLYCPGSSLIVPYTGESEDYNQTPADVVLEIDDQGD